MGAHVSDLAKGLPAAQLRDNALFEFGGDKFHSSNILRRENRDRFIFHEKPGPAQIYFLGSNS